MGRVSVTWLELFFDLSVVLAVHNVAVPMEKTITIESSFSYVLRIILLWFIWHFMSTTVNLSNKRRFFERGSEDLGADTWLGWRETLCIVFTMCFVTLMSNAAYVDNNAYYYGYFCLAEIAVCYQLKRPTLSYNLSFYISSIYSLGIHRHLLSVQKVSRSVFPHCCAY